MINPTRTDPSRSYAGNPQAYDQIKSRTPEQRRARRQVEDNQRRAASLRGAQGIQRDGDIIRAGPELTNPITSGASTTGTMDLEVVENAQLIIVRFSGATFLEVVPLVP